MSTSTPAHPPPSQSLPPIAYKQDLPPAEGYGTIRYKRNLPFKGPSGAVIFGVVGAITMFGQWHLVRTKKERYELKKERAVSQYNLFPFLLAEDEREHYRRNYASLMREAVIMKDVAGWEVGVTDKPYNSERYQRAEHVV